MRRTLLFFAFAASVALAQRPERIAEVMESAAKAQSGTTAAGTNPSLLVSKTARVEGPDVCGVIRITNTGFGPVTVSGIADSLEVHFSNNVPPPGLTAGSTPNWFKVAEVPIPLPGPIAPRATATIPYCFSICQARDYPGANSMRNVVAVFVGIRWWGARSNSFQPPFLDCQACCLPDGSCTDTVPERCTAANGLPRGTGTGCDTTACTQGCCLSDATCGDRTMSECELAGGEPLGLGSSCTSVHTTCRGACCNGSGCIENLAKFECEDDPTNGLQGTYLGSGTTCASQVAICPSGACCEGGTATCVDTRTAFGFVLHDNQAGCENSLGGTYFGDGTTCETVTTSCRGACCTGAGCVDEVGAGECRFIFGTDGSGTYLGNDTTCATQIAACPTGACCEGGTGSCRDSLQPGSHVILSNQGQCEIGFGGLYLGDGTTCETVTTSCRGACCTGAGCVDDVGAGECRFIFGTDGSGTYLGNDTTCATQIAACPTGACCEGGTGSCRDSLQPGSHVILSNQGQCEIGFGGLYLGDGTSCASSSCTEACCFGDSCEELLPSDCEDQGGDPQGPGTGCPNFGPTPCDVSSP